MNKHDAEFMHDIEVLFNKAYKDGYKAGRENGIKECVNILSDLLQKLQKKVNGDRSNMPQMPAKGGDAG